MWVTVGKWGTDWADGYPCLLDQIDQLLKRWVQQTVGERKVSFGLPGVAEDGSGVGLYLMEMAPRPPARGARRPALQVWLRYLVTTWAADPAEAHQALGRMLFDAMKQSEFEVEPDPLPWQAWQAFGVPPRPAFVIRVP